MIWGLSPDERQNIAFVVLDLPKAIAGGFGPETLQPCDIHGNPTSTRHGTAAAMADVVDVAQKKKQYQVVMAARNGAAGGTTRPYEVRGRADGEQQVLGRAGWPYNDVSDCYGTLLVLCWDLLMAVAASPGGMAALSTQSATTNVQQKQGINGIHWAPTFSMDKGSSATATTGSDGGRARLPETLSSPDEKADFASMVCMRDAQAYMAMPTQTEAQENELLSWALSSAAAGCFLAGLAPTSRPLAWSSLHHQLARSTRRWMPVGLPREPRPRNRGRRVVIHRRPSLVRSR